MIPRFQGLQDCSQNAEFRGSQGVWREPQRAPIPWVVQELMARCVHWGLQQRVDHSRQEFVVGRMMHWAAIVENGRHKGVEGDSIAYVEAKASH